jgi:hypothetical protein
MNTSSLFVHSLIPSLFVFLCACSETAPPPPPTLQDSTVALPKDTAFPPKVTLQDRQVTDSPAQARKPAYVETERERKERAYWELQKNPDYQKHKLGIPVFLDRDSAGHIIKKPLHDTNSKVINR